MAASGSGHTTVKGPQDIWPPFFAPLSPAELQKLKEVKYSALPAKLHDLLRRHYTPVRHLFRFLGGNLDGTLTRHELYRALKALGVELTKADAEDLFRGLLEFAIDEGEVALSFRSIQKAIYSVKSGHKLTTYDNERRQLLERIEAIESSQLSASQEAERALTARGSAEARATAADEARAAAEAETAVARQAEMEAVRLANVQAEAAKAATAKLEGLRDCTRACGYPTQGPRPLMGVSCPLALPTVLQDHSSSSNLL